MRKPYDKSPGNLLTYIFALMFISGTAAGSAIAFFTAGTFSPVPSSAGAVTIFMNSFITFLKPCLVIWIACFTSISAYISAFVVAYRGGMFGFVLCMIFKNYGFAGGILKALCISLPQNLIYFPFLLFLCLACAARKRKFSGRIILLMISIVICAISALTDAFITSELIKFTF